MYRAFWLCWACILGLTGMSLAEPRGAVSEEDFLIGGPLAGVQLPRYVTQHGEKPGYPGCLPEIYGSEGQAPERELYPGSVEHWRAYMFKYMPIRSFFDRQSLMHNWVAPEIPGADSSQIEPYASPLYWVPRHGDPVHTNKFLQPVSVVRCTVGNPRIHLDLGTLDVGLYAVRVIGAVETQKLRPFRKPLYIRMKVNDKLSGEDSTYRVSCGYVDEFYSVAELYFHAVEKRTFRVELCVDDGSQVDLLVHNITLDDVLAGSERRAIKTSRFAKVPVTGSPRPEASPNQTVRPKKERWDRDAQLWAAFPPINAQGGGDMGVSHAHYHVFYSEGVTRGAAGKPETVLHEQFGEWTLEPIHSRTSHERFFDGKAAFLRNAKLGLEYTLDDLGEGRALPDPYPLKDDGAGLFFPNPDQPDVGQVWDPIARAVDERIWNYVGAEGLPMHGSVELWERDGDREAARDAAVALIRFAYQMPTIEMSNYISSVARIPGRSGRDLSCRNMMTSAFWLMHYDRYEEPLRSYDRLFNFIQGNEDLAASVGRFVPWVTSSEDLIELLDVYLVQTTAKRIMRYHYHTHVAALNTVIEVLGDPLVTDAMRQWLLERAWQYPLEPVGLLNVAINGHDREGASYIGSTFYATRPGLKELQKYEAYSDWRRGIIVCGFDFLRIGDVCGPDKAPGSLGSERVTLDNRSRALDNWAGILEAGHVHDDHRLRRAAYVRVGMGTGHHHNDSLDLQIVAHGLPMTIDGGQRPGYSNPPDSRTRVHNVVEVNGSDHRAPSWVQTIADVDGVQYMQINGVPPAGATLFRRQVALIDVDEGDEREQAGVSRFANSYIFDVFRVSGGNRQTYCFHGPVNDSFVSNVLHERPTSDKYLAEFPLPDTKFEGEAPDHLTATWRYGRQGIGSEAFMLGNAYRSEAPRKFTRLHLLGVLGSRVLRADAHCHERQYRYTCLYAQRQSTASSPLESAFTAVVEPYAGQPFIEDCQLIRLEDGGNDAQRAVLVRITARNGHTDLCFADGQANKLRSAGEFRFHGQFAYYSTDKSGFRQAALAGARLLAGPDVRLEAATSVRRAIITAVDYSAKQLHIDERWPAASSGRLLEIGSPLRTVSYTVANILPAECHSSVTLTRGADYYRSPIESVDPTTGTVHCVASLPLGTPTGLTADWTATNDSATTYWRAESLSANSFRLTGEPVSERAFGPSNVLRLWEFGVGDEVRQATYAYVRRVADNIYEIGGDTDLTLKVRSSELLVSEDREEWKQTLAEQKGEWVQLRIPVAAIENGPLFVRFEPRPQASLETHFRRSKD